MQKELYGVQPQLARPGVPKPLTLPKVRPCLMSPAKGRSRLELPIDHFRLLGVAPTTDAQSVLRTLQQRLDRAPDQGFTEETLQSREELLRASADLLSDADRRLIYETDLTAISSGSGASIAALDVPSPNEVGGLLLLLEAGQPLECFELANRALQPPRAPALGSGREADLTLLAGLSCLAAAADQHQRRRYESSAQTLRQGLQLLQRMGQLPALRHQINQELEGLTPFRVLDLLSRNLTAVRERAEGLALLEELVQRRGGLEGHNDPSLTAEEFQAFFKQIRAFLTVQEQVDVFSRWADDSIDATSSRPGSRAADFLATTALTASGFGQRKPERIAAAKLRLQASGTEGTQPLLACLHLLLGEVEQAQQAFFEGASPELRQWAAKQSADPLAQLCAYCSDWLSRDVLPGYRDLEADADLEAYFADRDVLAFVEGQEPFTGPASPSETSASSMGSGNGGFTEETWSEASAKRQFSLFGAASNFLSGFTNPFASDGEPALNSSPAAGQDDQSPLGLGRPAPERNDLDKSQLDGNRLDANRLDANDFNGDGLLEDGQAAKGQPWLQTLLPQWHWPKRPALPAIQLPSKRLVGFASAGLVVAVAATALLRSRSQTPKPPLPPQQALATKPVPVAKPVPQATPAAPLTTADPSDAQIQALLEAWLNAKAALLAGKTSTIPLAAMARPSQIERLEAAVAANQNLGVTEVVTTKIQSFAVDERSPNRIAATVGMDYSETALDANGSPTGTTSTLQLRNRYLFSYDEGTWRLLSYRRAAS